MNTLKFNKNKTKLTLTINNKILKLKQSNNYRTKNLYYKINNKYYIPLSYFDTI